MADVWLILGGARSGKTTRGLTLVGKNPKPIYIATAEARDGEMQDRIVRHKAERGPEWTTVEAPLDLRGALLTADGAGKAILVDCLTLWLSNLMEAGRAPEDEVRALVAALQGMSATVVFVSNEAGLGIVPDNSLARAFRDAQGRINQIVATVANHVELIVAGLPLTIK